MSAATRAARRARASGSWLVSAAVFATIGIPLWGLSPVIDGSSWWFVAMGFVGLVLGVGATLRAVGLAAWLSVSGGAVACWIAIQAAFAPGTAVVGILPTTGTIDTLVLGFVDAGRQIQEQAAPADPVPSLVQLIAVAAALVALLADAAIASRFPAFVGAIAAALIVTPYTIVSGTFDGALFAATAASFLLVLWLAARTGRAGAHKPEPRALAGRAPATAAAVAAAAVVIALAIPQLTPGLGPDAFDARAGDGAPLVYGAGVDPVIQLGRDLRRSTPVVALSYETSADKPLYLKMVDLSDFATGDWAPDAASASATVPSQGVLPSPPGLADEVARTTVESSISVAELRSEWVPLPVPATTVSDLDHEWTVDPQTGTVTFTDAGTDSRGENYEVQSLQLNPSTEQLAASGSPLPVSFERFLALPPQLPAAISETARSVTAAADSNYDRAVALQSYFTSGQFSYSVQAPVDGGFDGTNAEAMGAFLEAKKGYCVHFASTMATMARVVGIPSRIAVGYLPKSASTRTASGDTLYRVLTDQLHSWPELYFEGIGWLPFEPTPGRGISVPDYSLPGYAEGAGDPSVRQPSSATSAPSSRARDDKGTADSTPSASERSRLEAQLRGWLIAALVIVALGILMLVPAGLRAFRRRRAIARIRRGEHPATAAWRELLDVSRDYRLDVRAGDTPGALFQRLVAIEGMPGSSLSLLRHAVEREQFAHPERTSADTEEQGRLIEALGRVSEAVRVAAAPGVRRSARLYPASLFARATVQRSDREREKESV